MAGVVQTSLDGWEQRARRWLVEVFGRRGTSPRATYVHEVLDALIAGRPLPDPAASGRWLGGKRERTVDRLRGFLAGAV